MTEKEPNTPDAQTPKFGENSGQTAGQQDPKANSTEYVQELEQQLDESRKKYMYLYSDMENLRRHAARERIEMVSTAGRDIMSALLPVLDDFDRAAKNGALDEGMTLIYHKLAHILKSKGLHLIETRPGDPFNPDTHEAIVEIPAPTPDLKGKIVDVIEQGYTLGDRIIRYAKVVVGQ